MLIGKEVLVARSSDSTLISRSGMVVDETKNMLSIRNGFDRMIRIPKEICSFEIKTNGKTILLSGCEIVGTVQERIHRL